MPLSVPLLLVPGEPDRHYTVHLHRVRWSVGSVSRTLTADHLAELGANAQRCLRMVSECIAAELSGADVEVTENPDGSAEAVARVLCTEDACAAVAEQYHRDADEDVEAEAAREWAAGKLVDQDVQLLRLREELQRPMHGKTTTSAADMLSALLADQQERTGGSPDTVVLWADEMTEVAARVRENTLFPDQTPDEVREEIERLIRTGRTPYPIERRYGKTAPWDLGLMEPQSSAGTWTTPPIAPLDPVAVPADSRAHLDLVRAFHMAPEHLVRDTETLARSVAAGQSQNVGVKRLAELCGELARRHDADPQPPCHDGCREDADPAHDLEHRIGYRPRAVPAGEVRAARIILIPAMPLHTLPETLPDDDAALVLVYRRDTPGLALLDAARAGDDDAVQDAVTGLLRWFTADGK
ncbi:hypothetical protein [Streptomyces sp. SYSU K217416]